MPRLDRIVIPDLPHHVTQRGNNRQKVFFSDHDREFYLTTLKKQADRHGLEIIGYCLMTNHVHLVVRPETEESLSPAIGRTHWLYSQHINLTRRRTGHLWQGRFHSCPLGDPHFWWTLSYIEQNPVRAKIVRLPWEYAWSSARAHVGHPDTSGLIDCVKWKGRMDPEDWKQILLERLDDDEVDRLRACTKRGRPFGSVEFLSKLEEALGIRPLPVGRPRKTKRP